MNLFLFINKHLKIKLIGSALVFLIMISSFMVYLFIISEKKNIHEQTDYRGNKLAEISAIFSIEPFLVNDYPVLQTYIDKLTRESQNVVFARIERNDGKILVQAPTDFSDDYLSYSPKSNVKIYSSEISISIESAPPLGKVVLGISTTELEQKLIDRVQNIIAISFLSILLLVLILAGLLSNLVIRRISILKEAVAEFGKGNLHSRLDISPKDELGQLGDSFNVMATDLQKTTVSKNYVNNIIKSIKEMLWVVDSEGMILVVNKRVCELLGYDEDALIGTPVNNLIDLENGKPFDVDSFIDKDLNNSLRAKCNKIIPVLYSTSIIEDPDGKKVTVITAKDMREQVGSVALTFSSYLRP